MFRVYGVFIGCFRVFRVSGLDPKAGIPPSPQLLLAKLPSVLGLKRVPFCSNGLIREPKPPKKEIRAPGLGVFCVIAWGVHVASGDMQLGELRAQGFGKRNRM